MSLESNFALKLPLWKNNKEICEKCPQKFDLKISEMGWDRVRWWGGVPQPPYWTGCTSALGQRCNPQQMKPCAIDSICMSCSFWKYNNLESQRSLKFHSNQKDKKEKQAELSRATLVFSDKFPNKKHLVSKYYSLKLIWSIIKIFLVPKNVFSTNKLYRTIKFGSTKLWSKHFLGPTKCLF